MVGSSIHIVYNPSMRTCCSSFIYRNHRIVNFAVIRKHLVQSSRESASPYSLIIAWPSSSISAGPSESSQRRRTAFAGRPLLSAGHWPTPDPGANRVDLGRVGHAGRPALARGDTVERHAPQRAPHDTIRGCHSGAEFGIKICPCLQ